MRGVDKEQKAKRLENALIQILRNCDLQKFEKLKNDYLQNPNISDNKKENIGYYFREINHYLDQLLYIRDDFLEGIKKLATEKLKNINGKTIFLIWIML